jgi:hypothetical protein
MPHLMLESLYEPPAVAKPVKRLWFGRHCRLVNLTPTGRSAKTLALSAASGQKRLLFSTRR